MGTRKLISQECGEVLDLMDKFIEETTAPLDCLDLGNIVNSYFSMTKGGTIYLNVSNGKCNLGTHSTLDITNPRNIIVYFRTVFKNKLKQNENSESIGLN